MPDTGSDGAPLLLVAAGGLAREAAAAARAAGQRVVGCLDDDPSRRGTNAGPDLRVLATVDEVGAFSEARVVICAGRGRTRRTLAERLSEHGVGDERLGTIVHPSVHLPLDSRIGAGSILLAGVVLTAAVSLGNHVVCMPNVVLTHDCRVDDYGTVCAGVALGGGVTIGSAAYLGMAASVREGCRVGADAVVGMGAVVLTDVPEGEVWAGVPARRLNPS